MHLLLQVHLDQSDPVKHSDNSTLEFFLKYQQHQVLLDILSFAQANQPHR